MVSGIFDKVNSLNFPVKIFLLEMIIGGWTAMLWQFWNCGNSEAYMELPWKRIQPPPPLGINAPVQKENQHTFQIHIILFLKKTYFVSSIRTILRFKKIKEEKPCQQLRSAISFKNIHLITIFMKTKKSTKHFLSI